MHDIFIIYYICYVKIFLFNGIIFVTIILSYYIQISNFLLIRVLHLDDNDVKTNYRRIFSTVSASTPFSTNK